MGWVVKVRVSGFLQQDAGGGKDARNECRFEELHVDQPLTSDVNEIITGIKTKPDGKRLLMSGWKTLRNMDGRAKSRTFEGRRDGGKME